MKQPLLKWLVLSVLLFMLSKEACTQDPNFHLYICFGQSNMEGQGTIEAQDQSVDSRFQIFQAVSCTGKPQEKWRTATPPLARCNTKLGPADYFGREMVKNLPSNIKVGIIFVAIAGCKIELFDKANYTAYINSLTANEQWMKSIINEYGGNPYAKLVSLSKLAQKDGVIKGILLHQGESNYNDTQWPNKVRGVYTNLLTDLGLTAANVPLLAGQVVDAAQGGQTAGMNSIINSLPNTIPTAHVISSSGCTDQSDNLHFTSDGYRLLGTRYAQKMLTLVKVNTNEPPTITANLSDLTLAENQPLTLTIGASGSNLTYVWYKNNQVVAGANTATLTVAQMEQSDDNSTFKVVVSNAYGSVTSKVISIKVTDFLGVKITKSATAIVLDGSKEEGWANSEEYEIKNKILSIDNEMDLSGKVNVLYDNQYLYVLYTITDNQKRASSTNFWENDGVELYIDGNNDKATTYDADDFQYVFRYDASQILEGHNKSVTGITAKALQTNTGYTIEAAIPWMLIGIAPTASKNIGLDFHVNDSDLGLRDGKLAWYATEDNSYSNPSTFGLGRLESTMVTSLQEGQPLAQITLFPNPAKSTIWFQGMSKEFTYQILDGLGRQVQAGSAHATLAIDHLSTGIYNMCIQNGIHRKCMNFIKE